MMGPAQTHQRPPVAPSPTHGGWGRIYIYI